MKNTNRSRNAFANLAVLACAAFIFLAGCLPTGESQSAVDNGHAPEASTATSSTAGATTPEPFFPADFRDILIPGELEWRRDKSVSINTDSFTGGILNFTGRVEVNSLTEFFINGMKKDGWELIGSVKSENVLLAFVKEKASCMIKIDDGGTLGKTVVNIFTTRKNG